MKQTDAIRSAPAWDAPAHGLEALAGLVQQRQGLLRSAGRPQHAGQEKARQRQIVISVGIRLLARRPGTRWSNCCAPSSASRKRPPSKLLLDAGPRRLEPRVIPGVAQRRRWRRRAPAHALQQSRLAGKLQHLAERRGQINRRLRVPRACTRSSSANRFGSSSTVSVAATSGSGALLHEEPDIRAHRLDPAGRQRFALRRVHPPAQVGAQRGIEREMIVAVRRRQPCLDQFDCQRGHVRLFHCIIMGALPD